LGEASQQIARLGLASIGTTERITVAKLIYSAIASLDGYIEDADGNFDWAEPDEEVHAFVNDLERSAGTHLYGRRMYEMMVGWETDPTLAEQSPLMRDFAGIWQAADKVVLEDVGERRDGEDADRAGLRPRSGSADEGVSRP
jgi:RibD C-terminal domain